MNFSVKFWKIYLLGKTDWTQLSDIELTTEEKQAWAVYRQALRDLDSTKSIFDGVKFPIPPRKIEDIDSSLFIDNREVLFILNII